jgi:hypothetical protein
MVAAKRHQPPSRTRYAAEHPTIGVHCDRETYQRLVALRERSGLSLGQLVKQELGVAEEDIDTVRERAYAEGFEAGRKAGWTQARSLYRLTYACSVCRGPIAIESDSEQAKIATMALTAQGWHHVQCPRRVA